MRHVVEIKLAGGGYGKLVRERNAMRTEIPIPTERLDEFCRRWKIAELRVFGSALREDFGPDSDLDLLVRFAPEADWSLMDHVAMEEELSGIVARKVDLVSERAIERSSNWIRRKAILESAEPYFASR
jgi:predicted nucleotidyltransferase